MRVEVFFVCILVLLSLLMVFVGNIDFCLILDIRLLLKIGDCKDDFNFFLGNVDIRFIGIVEMELILGRVFALEVRLFGVVVIGIGVDIEIRGEIIIFVCCSEFKMFGLDFIEIGIFFCFFDFVLVEC